MDLGLKGLASEQDRQSLKQRLSHYNKDFGKLEQRLKELEDRASLANADDFEFETDDEEASLLKDVSGLKTV